MPLPEFLAGAFLLPFVCPVVCPQAAPCVSTCRAVVCPSALQGSKGRQPFCRWGSGHTLGHTLCVSTPHPAYGVSDDFGNGKGEVCRFPFHKKGRVWNTPSLTNGYQDTPLISPFASGIAPLWTPRKRHETQKETHYHYLPPQGPLRLSNSFVRKAIKGKSKGLYDNFTRSSQGLHEGIIRAENGGLVIYNLLVFEAMASRKARQGARFRFSPCG